MHLFFFFFFFQAEDGIRDGRVTGVQTCALPILTSQENSDSFENLMPGFSKHKKPADRKSTRLNSSHPSISYAVFCLKKKKKKYNIINTEKNYMINLIARIIYSTTTVIITTSYKS